LHENVLIGVVDATGTHKSDAEAGAEVQAKREQERVKVHG
jgi:hypothetical protein